MQALAGARSAVQDVDFHFIPCVHPASQSALTGADLEQFLLRIRLLFLGGAGVEMGRGYRESLGEAWVQPRSSQPSASPLASPFPPLSAPSDVWVPPILSLPRPVG